MISCKPVDTPISASKAIILPDPLFYNATCFRQIVGTFQYLAFMRLDICFVFIRVYQFMHASTYSHWAAIKRILCSLKGFSTHNLHITHSPSFSHSFALHGFTNTDWQVVSTSGYLVLFGQTSILWKSGKQRTVARFSTKAEYKALVNGTAEVIWLQYLLTYFQILSISAPIIWCDNLGATYLSVNPVFSCSHKTY